MSLVPAIRLRGVGRYFGPALEMDGVEHPREAWRSLLRIAGIGGGALYGDGADPQVTVAAAGHVLRDVSLDIDHGSVVCLAGPSGSGKSVLLQLIAGVVPPTSGRIEASAPITALLAVGDNLDAALTARENIAAAGSPADAAPDADEVIAFAGLQGFEDAPIRTFSTGMVLRLSVALALCGRPPIVLIDDVLTVGDIAFQQQCIDRLHELKEAGSTLVLAFSDEDVVRQLATRIVTLGGGGIVSDTQADDWRERPRRGGSEVTWQLTRHLPEDDVLAMERIEVERHDGSEDGLDGPASRLDVAVALRVKAPGLRFRPVMTVATTRQAIFRSVYPEFVDGDTAGARTFTLSVPLAILPGGEYVVGVSVGSQRGASVYAMKCNDAVTFTLRRDGPTGDDTRPRPLLTVDWPWEVERLAAPVA